MPPELARCLLYDVRLKIVVQVVKRLLHLRLISAQIECRLVLLRILRKALYPLAVPHGDDFFRPCVVVEIRALNFDWVSFEVVALAARCLIYHLNHANATPISLKARVISRLLR